MKIKVGKKYWGVKRPDHQNPTCITDNLDEAKYSLDRNYTELVELTVTAVYSRRIELELSTGK